MAYESGELTFQQVIEMFQQMIDDGSVWTFPGHYGRTATALIEAGNCTPQRHVDETDICLIAGE